MDSYQCYCIWVWDSKTACICNTISCFPTKIVIPLAFTADCAPAGITDIHQDLYKPAPELHHPPNHISALKQLTEVLMSVAMTDNAHTLSPKNAMPLRVESLHPIATCIEVDALSLRVVIPPIVMPSPAIVSPKGTLCSFPIRKNPSYLPQ
jgi:hypothetical protein